MSITVLCPHCGHRTQASELYAGMSGPCHKCGGDLRVPQPKRPNSRRKWLIVGGVVVLLLILSFVVASAYKPRFSDGPSGAPLSCRANLSRIGVALREYHNTYGSYPPAVIEADNGEPMHSWRVLILPFLGEHELYAAYDFNEPWYADANRRLLMATPQVYHCDSTWGAGFTSYQALLGEHTAIGEREGRRVSQILDPLHTAAMVIDDNRLVEWTRPDDFDLSSPYAVRASWTSHHGTVRMLYADGAVRDHDPRYFDEEQLQQEAHVRDGRWSADY